QSESTPAFADLVATLGDSIADVGNVPGADSAAAEAERGDGVEQPILRVRRQVTQQSFGDPGGRSLGAEADGAQGAYPVVAQVDGHRFAVARPSRARLAMGTCVEPAGQDGGLDQTGLGVVVEEVVEEPGSNRHPLGEPL